MCSLTVADRKKNTHNSHRSGIFSDALSRKDSDLKLEADSVRKETSSDTLNTIKENLLF